MKKVVSYRQKLLELARIYKIDKVFDQNIKYTTYEIEIILLKNNVPIPSRRGYISHKFINEVFKPFYETFGKKLSTNINIRKSLNNFSESFKKKLFINTNIRKNLNNFSESFRKKLSINTFIRKYLKKFYNAANAYFEFIILNIVNFFKILFKTIIEGLNDIYNFKVK